MEFREIEALPQTPPYPTHNPYSKEKAELGEKLFNDPKLSASNQIACANCHNGVEFSDNKYHNLGLHFYGREKYEDLGRYEVSKNIADVGAFKTPSLRGVSKSAPYMHNGLFPHLSGVIHAYNAGMANPTPKDGKFYNPPFPQTSHLLQKLNLSKDEMEALEAFLRAL